MAVGWAPGLHILGGCSEWGACLVDVFSAVVHTDGLRGLLGQVRVHGLDDSGCSCCITLKCCLFLLVENLLEGGMESSSCP